MISKHSHSQEWIMRVRETAFGKDPILIEKMIMALTLLENLHNSGLDFVFKGGTALILLFKTPRRFSIDIDVLLADDKHLESHFQKVVEQGVFHRYEENRRAGELPKAHYKFFFHSVIQNKESQILLDILFEQNPYPKTRFLPIETPLLAQEGEPVTITCPVAECLLGDKLTAFAPRTTGIQYGLGKELEIAKQLFDIGLLFDVAEELPLVLTTFESIAEQELVYRGLPDLTPQDVLQDTFETACMIGMRGAGAPQEYSELQDGF
ncbi:MAG: nucleotidyl transferase AbiEii/AbiGii toxin family protein, partial [Candidatus Latescibacteria bacterium]|nr:nucleotidyl transferase AbiEii/AbiGii toxin family protein [Candidatus Latescibacterota bacterium]